LLEGGHFSRRPGRETEQKANAGNLPGRLRLRDERRGEQDGKTRQEASAIIYVHRYLAKEGLYFQAKLSFLLEDA